MLRTTATPQVSTLLLGLVDLSASRYLGRSLAARLAPSPSPAAASGAPASPAAAAASSQAAGEAALKEEQRAAAFWAAPFMLFVQVRAPRRVSRLTCTRKVLTRAAPTAARHQAALSGPCKAVPAMLMRYNCYDFL